MEKKTGNEMAREVANFVNSFNQDNEGFVQGIMESHRTLQQNTFKLMVECIYAWSEQYENETYDLRNEATCKISHELAKILQNSIIPYV